MFATLKTLVTGANARAEEQLRDAYAIELIDQKIRESQTALQAAKATLASLIQRQRMEGKQVTSLETKIADLTKRATLALKDGNEDMAAQAADSIAQIENELASRRTTLERLDTRILQLRSSVESGHRRIVDLKQGAIQAKAVRREQQMQSRLNTTLTGSSSVEEAQDLIAQVIGKDDPFEQSLILSEINNELNHDGLADRLADAGYGKPNRSTGADVLARLKSKS